MGVWEIVVGSAVLLLSIIMIIVIILQEGHEAGLGTVTGGADSFLSRGKARTADALFARITRYCAIVFFVLVILLNALSYFGLSGRTAEEAEEISLPSTEVSVAAEDSEVSQEEASAAESSAETSASESAAEESGTESSESEESDESSTEEADAGESTEDSQESDAE
ncbi:MAG: preprotein translocase subunit SecG [Clostridia bacterium]|nr:preprotein translocase subunit SecG [Clostridia bacterium]